MRGGAELVGGRREKRMFVMLSDDTKHLSAIHESKTGEILRSLRSLTMTALVLSPLPLG